MIQLNAFEEVMHFYVLKIVNCSRTNLDALIEHY